MAPPTRIVVADDTITADAAFRLASEGTAILWRADFHNAKQLLRAMARRIEAKRKSDRKTKPLAPSDAFHRHRLAQTQRARTWARC